MRASVRRLGASLIASTAFGLFSTAALAGDISVPMDEVQMLTFTRPVSTVYVGNPSVADVTVIDATHVFVLGRAFGRTNLIALGPDGKQVTNSRINVYGRGGSTVTVQRGSNAVTYACSGSQCHPAPVPGDNATVFDSVTGQVAKSLEMGLKAAGK
ncbi:MAG: hypothetical protein GC166_12420 [Alphaproteobacteria bacterium]|nr:hypothetical protein [Alphaproteobacteria bacterium]